MKINNLTDKEKDSYVRRFVVEEEAFSDARIETTDASHCNRRAMDGSDLAPIQRIEARVFFL